jgi:hypothetical protein
MRKKKIPDLEITELILIKCGINWSVTYIGTITRSEDGNPVVYGSAVIGDGTIWSMATSQEELENNLDDICFMHLESGLHSDTGATTMICMSEFNLN